MACTLVSTLSCLVVCSRYRQGVLAFEMVVGRWLGGLYGCECVGGSKLCDKRCFISVLTNQPLQAFHVWCDVLVVRQQRTRRMRRAMLMVKNSVVGRGWRVSHSIDRWSLSRPMRVANLMLPETVLLSV